MRMPVLSYFFFTGAGLLAGLFLLSSLVTPGGAPIETTQVVGLPQPYKAPPSPPPAAEPMPQLALTTAPMPVARPVKLLASRQKAAKKVVKLPARSRFAEYPHGFLNFP